MDWRLSLWVPDHPRTTTTVLLVARHAAIAAHRFANVPVQRLPRSLGDVSLLRCTPEPRVWREALLSLLPIASCLHQQHE